MVAGCVVVRRRPRRCPERRREPGERRSRRGDLVCAASRAAVAGRPAGRDRPVRGGPGGRCTSGPAAVADAVGQPGLLRADPGEPGAAGAARHDRGHDRRGARLGNRAGKPCRRAARPSGADCLDRACRRADRYRGWGIPAATPGPERTDPGPRGGRVHLGVRPGVRPDPDRRRHRPELRPAAGPPCPGLLAACHGRDTGSPHAGGRPPAMAAGQAEGNDARPEGEFG